MPLHPLVIPLLGVTAGALAGYFAFSRLRRRDAGGRSMVLALIATAAAAVVVSNAGQQFYEFGLSIAAIDVLAMGSYAVFGLSIAGTWVLLGASRKRWLLTILIPIALAQPLLSTFAIFVWSTRGFAP